MDTEKQNVNIFNITAGYFEKVDNALSKQTKTQKCCSFINRIVRPCDNVESFKIGSQDGSTKAFKKKQCCCLI